LSYLVRVSAQENDHDDDGYVEDERQVDVPLGCFLADLGVQLQETLHTFITSLDHSLEVSIIV